ncbi:MAG: TonB-dependent receptor [Rhodothermales bacterium]
MILNRITRLSTILVVVVLAAGLAPRPVLSQATVIEGSIRSTNDNHPVEFALVFLEEIRRSATSDVLGIFRIANVPDGPHSVQISRIGYENLTRVIDVSDEDTLRITFFMDPEVIVHDEVVVQGDRSVGEAIVTEQELKGEQLREHLGTTIAETLNDLPGLSMRSMGPAPARPVLRGLGGERLLVLENGSRTGDLSQTSSDHALVVDPLAAERMEIVRGPAALIYGSNTMAGAINVVKESVLSSVPDHIHANATLQAQSVSSGLASGFSMAAPVGSSFAIHASGTAREAHDVRTPAGRLGNTDLSSWTGEAGISWIRSWGYVGFNGSLYDSDYGIPGGFVGAHPNGVSISVDRKRAEYRAELLRPKPWIDRLEWVGTWTRYFHQEFESSGALGIEYGVLTWSTKLTAHTGRWGFFDRGAVGLWAEFRDYVAGGFSFTPATTERTIAGFAYQDFHIGSTILEAGLRFDSRVVTPSSEFNSDIGEVRQRSLGGLSASLSVLQDLGDGWSARAMAMRSLRLPGIEELLSEGPHLAAYSFEVGNPDLPEEIGAGAELTLLLNKERVSGTAAVFVNQFEGYIFPRNTGELNFRIYVPIYQYTGNDARLFGAEGSIQVDLGSRHEVQSTFSWVRGELTDSGTPIPWTPPLKGRLAFVRNGDLVKWTASLRGASQQTRLGPFEEPTDGYVVPDLAAQMHFVRGGMLHTVTLAMDNLTNTTYRDHLSRVKSVMPEPGRNVRLLYRLHF